MEQTTLSASNDTIVAHSLAAQLSVSHAYNICLRGWLAALVSPMSLGAALFSARHSFHANDLALNDSGVQ